MPRGRKKMDKKAGKVEDFMCCPGKQGKIISVGFLFVILGLALKFGFNVAELFLLVGAIFLLKGLLMDVFKK